MNKRIAAIFLLIVVLVATVCPVQAETRIRSDAPDYKVAFYQSPNYHMMDENGKKSGYGYELMQDISNYMQCTFSYVGYEKTPEECIELLRNGELDIYTAARWSAERTEEFAISKHPSISATTCMNIKVGNDKIVAGDYATYEGITVGLQSGHTYNDAFIEFAKEKGFSCKVVYFDTASELTNALIQEEIDALVSSYIRIPQDEQQIETFGQTPYYFMARKEDQVLIDAIDEVIDKINIENPHWRTDLYAKYYRGQEENLELTEEEDVYLQKLQAEKTVIRAVANPDAAPYSWYENGKVYGIAVDLFKKTAKELDLKYQFIPAKTKAEYQKALLSGEADIWLDFDEYYNNIEECRYKSTDTYLTTMVSVLRSRSATQKIGTLAVEADDIAMKEIAKSVWPEAEIVEADSLKDCKQKVLNQQVDGALLMTYTAQKVAKDDVQNRLRADLISEATMEFKMAIHADMDYRFLKIWDKTMCKVSEKISETTVQNYVEVTENLTIAKYLFDHPIILSFLILVVLLVVFLVFIYVHSLQSKKQQEVILQELKVALAKAERANEAKQDFFSKMSHDIRTPLNVVLGMTQIAQKNMQNTAKLEEALNTISQEGHYLLVLINSILDINQLEHGSIELLQKPFQLENCVKRSVEILQPLAEQKQQAIIVECNSENKYVIGDVNRLCQIFVNIISNAIKYTDVGGKIHVRLETVSKNRYRFICEDNGIGMTPEYIKHICEEYSRAEDSRVSKIQGTGLGMSVVKGFIQLMNGTLTVKSKLGVGSTFIVELPLREASEKERETFMDVKKQEEMETTQFSGKKVLLVEDNELNVEIAKEMLSSIGFVIDQEENGKTAYDRYMASKAGEYFAIFMDIQMPVMDGVEATKLIRNSKRDDCDIPIFAMTANTFISDRMKYEEVGMNGHIPKPISSKAIITALKDGIK